VIRRIRSDLKTRRFWVGLFAKTFAGIGFEAVFLGLYDVINPNAISKLSIPTSAVVVALGFAYGIIRSWPSVIQQTYSAPSTQIRLIPGDLFSQSSNIVIGMCDTFDTAVPHIIERKSIQGQFLERIYHQDAEQLDKDLDRALSEVDPIGLIEKDGKRQIYPVGTVATIRNKRQHYFCVAYSSMDEKNQAQATIDGLWSSLSNLWSEVRANANGDPVAMAIVGGGQSRISQILPAQDSLRFIALSFILASRRLKVCDRLDIIIRKDDIEKIDMLEFQMFLTSLNL
jgi:hypothetical protein